MIAAVTDSLLRCETSKERVRTHGYPLLFDLKDPTARAEAIRRAARDLHNADAWVISRQALIAWEQRTGERFRFLHTELHSDGQPRKSNDAQRLEIFKTILEEFMGRQELKDAFALPVGSKKKLHALCHEASPGLFTPGENGTFNKFWKLPERKQICRLQGAEKYKGGREF